jgi:hypothetical protein
VDLTEDSFRALARSSPWRWRALHFVREDGRRPGYGPVEAWVRRPGRMVVRDAAGGVHRIDERGELGSSRVFLWSSTDPGVTVADPPGLRYPHEVAPGRRPDGLVAVRPPDDEVAYDDPMWQSYDWVAMLDPVELSHHTTLDSLRDHDRDGRRTWSARMRAAEGYEPRCGCCALLWSFISDRDEEADEDRREEWRPRPGVVYPDAYDVALDVQTGVVVDLRPLGGIRDDLGFAVRLLEVDPDLDALFPG